MTIRAEQVAAAEAIQFAAAHAPEAQVRLIAGPGSGKSLTIEERVRWLLESAIDPLAIAVVSFTNASVIDLKLRLHEYCRRHHQEGFEHVSITTLHSLALRLLRQAGLLETYPTRPLVLDDWELENIHDAEFGAAEGINSRPRREKMRRFYEALWSTSGGWSDDLRGWRWRPEYLLISPRLADRNPTIHGEVSYCGRSRATALFPVHTRRARRGDEFHPEQREPESHFEDARFALSERRSAQRGCRPSVALSDGGPRSRSSSPVLPAADSGWPLAEAAPYPAGHPRQSRCALATNQRSA